MRTVALLLVAVVTLLRMGCVTSQEAYEQEMAAAAGDAAKEAGACEPPRSGRGAVAHEVLRFPDTASLSRKVGSLVAEVVEQANGRDKFLVALSGGSLPKLLAEGLLDVADRIDFSKWHVFFADERYVAHDHEDSNLLACRAEFLSKVPGVKPENVHGIDISVPVDEAAKRYEAEIEHVTGLSRAKGELPVFDLVLLGMGPDGHTCSLFPGHPLLKETSVWVAPIEDSPKPPPKRITLTFPVLNNAANVYFLAAGKSKEDVIPLTAGLSLEELAKLGEASLPAARVRPSNGRLVWFVDDAAAGRL